MATLFLLRYDEARDGFFKEMCCVGRIGEAVEVAKTVAFLVSNDSTFMHGTDVVVDGGFQLK